MSAHVKQPARAGFTVIELLVAVMIMSVGILGMASVMGSSTRLQTLAASRAEMTTAAESKIEELRVYGLTSPTSPLRANIAVGGSLVASAAGYSDSTQSLSGRWYYRRWQIAAGVAGTRQVTMRVVPRGYLRNVVKTIDFNTLIPVTP
jgi:prepilin-type N-terminal cleavage/methylation domain-containing protein